MNKHVVTPCNEIDSIGSLLASEAQAEGQRGQRIKLWKREVYCSQTGQYPAR